MSVTSVPVSAMILRELGILKTKTGTVVISVFAIIDDIDFFDTLGNNFSTYVTDGTSFDFEEIGRLISFQISAYLLELLFAGFCCL